MEFKKCLCGINETKSKKSRSKSLSHDLPHRTVDPAHRSRSRLRRGGNHRDFNRSVTDYGWSVREKQLDRYLGQGAWLSAPRDRGASGSALCHDPEPGRSISIRLSGARLSFLQDRFGVDGVLDHVADDHAALV